MALTESSLVRIEANVSFGSEWGKLTSTILLPLFTLTYAARSLLRVNRSEAVGKV